MSALISRLVRWMDRRSAVGVLLFAATWAGCAVSAMTIEESSAILRFARPFDEVLITFRNGGSVRVQPYQHRWTDTVDAYLVHGRRRAQFGTRETEEFTGWIRASDVDSVQTIGSAATPFKVLHLNDGSLIYAPASDVRLRPAAEPAGFWCTGPYVKAQSDGFFGKDSTFLGVVDLSTVGSVEIVDKEMRAASTTLQGLGAIAAVPLLIGAAILLRGLWGM